MHWPSTDQTITSNLVRYREHHHHHHHYHHTCASDLANHLPPHHRRSPVAVLEASRQVSTQMIPSVTACRTMPTFLRITLLLILTTTSRTADAKPGASPFSPSWNLTLLGRTVHAIPDPSSSDVFLISALSIITRLDAATGNVRWRLPAPVSETPLHPLSAILSTFSSPVLLVHISDNTLRAIDPITSHTLWHHPACAVYAPNSGSIPITPCAKTDLTTPVNINIFTGAVLSSANTSVHLEVPPIPQTPSQTLEWTLSNGTLQSTPHGDLLLFSSPSSTPTWHRRDGLAHATSAALYTVDNSPMLIIQTALGELHGLRHPLTPTWVVPVGTHCTLLDGVSTHVATVCKRGAHTHVHIIKVADGTLATNTTLSNFVAVQAVLELCCDGACAILVDASGTERILSTPVCKQPPRTRAWLQFEHGGRVVRAMRNGRTVWALNLPGEAHIAAVVIQRQPPDALALRPAAVRVTEDRKVLWKFVEADIAFILALDEDAHVLHVLIVDTVSGAVHQAFEHRDAARSVSGVRGDNWLVYSFWNARMLQQELHVVDMYHDRGDGKWIRRRLLESASKIFGSGLLGLRHDESNSTTKLVEENSSMDTTSNVCDVDSGICAVNSSSIGTPKPQPRPEFSRSGMLVSQRIHALDVTESAMGMVEPSVIVTLENGQVAMISKLFLIARKTMTGQYNPAEDRVPYIPLIKVQSKSPMAKYVADGIQVPAIRKLVVAPLRQRESVTQIAIVGSDIVYAQVQPAGNFDALPVDFGYRGVLAMLGSLIAGVLYTNRQKMRTSLTRSWISSA